MANPIPLHRTPDGPNESVDRDQLAERVGTELRRIRRRRGLTQADAAVEVFGSEAMQSHWSRWERGVVMPQVGSLEKIAKWAGVSMAVFGVQDQPHMPSAADLEEAKELLRRAMKLLGGAGE